MLVSQAAGGQPDLGILALGAAHGNTEAGSGLTAQGAVSSVELRTCGA
jgi:hypothetical protein